MRFFTLASCTAVALALASGLQGCSATNSTPAPKAHAGESGSSAGTGAGATAGTDSGTAGAPSTAGGSGVGGTTPGTAGTGAGVAGTGAGTAGTGAGTAGTGAGTAGTGAGTAGTGAGTAGTGAGGTGAGTAGTGAGTAGAGTAGAGTAGAAGNGSGMPPGPLCTSETKGGTCSAAFPEGTSCYKTCGPESVGYKPETCTAGKYVEGACTFDYSNTSINWACYSVTGAPACAAGTQANMACTVGTCMPCTGTYLDTSSMSKMGNCVCTATMKWSCASATAWPASP